MSRVQRFFAAILPSSLMTAMENESRHWIIRCQACGDSRSVWQAGGIRYRASGNKWIFRRCRNCRRLSWQPIQRQTTADDSNICG
jgi:hypothetical protein